MTSFTLRQVLFNADGSERSVPIIYGRDVRTWWWTGDEPLDALTGDLPPEESGTLVIVQHFRPDRFFTLEQQDRLKQLMAQWRAARDRGTTLRTYRAPGSRRYRG